jgi:hypothetical protein
MSEEPRRADPGPAPTSKTTETRTETTEFQTSSDVRTSTSGTEERARDHGEDATDDRREPQDEGVRGQGEDAGDDRREPRDEGVRRQGEDAGDDQRDAGDAPTGGSLGDKLGDKLGLGRHGDRSDRDDTE